MGMGDSIKYFAIVFICGCIGIGLALILYILNAQGILIDEYITGSITIENVMALTILIWTLIGVVLSAIE